MKLEGAAALVTGAASGIGRATALKFAALGARVALVDIDAAGLESLAAEIAQAGGSAIAIPADVGEADAFDHIADTAERAFGHVYLLMNNVGVLATGRPEEIPPEEWSRILNLNLLSAVRATHRLIPGMIARGRGHIVNTASFAGLFPYAWDRLPYVASKAAMVAVSEGLALYLIPQGVEVTCFCPGPVRTGIGKQIRSWSEGIAPRGPGAQFAFLEAEEAAAVLVAAIEAGRFFVASDDQALIEMRRRGDDPEAYLRARLREMAADGAVVSQV